MRDPDTSLSLHCLCCLCLLPILSHCLQSLACFSPWERQAAIPFCLRCIDCYCLPWVRYFVYEREAGCRWNQRTPLLPMRSSSLSSLWYIWESSYIEKSRDFFVYVSVSASTSCLCLPPPPPLSLSCHSVLITTAGQSRVIYVGEKNRKHITCMKDRIGENHGRDAVWCVFPISLEYEVIRRRTPHMSSLSVSFPPLS